MGLLPPYYVGLSGFAVGSGLCSVNNFFFFFFFQILVQNFFLGFFFFFFGLKVGQINFFFF